MRKDDEPPFKVTSKPIILDVMKHCRLVNVTHLAALASLVAHFFLASPANAAASAWTSTEGAAIRIVAAKPMSDGTIPAILDVRLKPGWKTYWLEPGASGIAPQLTVPPESGVTFSGIRFPVPRHFEDGDVRFTGYDHSVAFPLKLKTENAGGDIKLKASVFLGVCKDICIPVQAELDVALPARMVDNPLEKARIDDAVAALPSEPSETFRVASASFDAATMKMRLAMTVPAGIEMPELFLAGPPNYDFGNPENIQRNGNTMTIDVPVRVPAKGGALKSGSVLLVAKAGEQSIESALAFD